MVNPIDGVKPPSSPDRTPDIKETKKPPIESNIESAASSILNNPREIKDVELSEEDSLAALDKAYKEFVQSAEESAVHTKLRETLQDPDTELFDLYDYEFFDYLETIPQEEKAILKDHFGEKTPAEKILDEQAPLFKYREKERLLSEMEELSSNEGKKSVEEKSSELPPNEYPVRTRKEKGKDIPGKESKTSLEKSKLTNEKEELQPPHGESKSTSEKVSTVGARQLGLSEKEPLVSTPRENRDRTLGLQFFRFLLRYLPNKLARPFSKVLIREGKVQLSEIDANLIPKLSPRLIRALSDGQLSNLTTRQFDQMNKAQLFAIGPRLTQINPKNMAYIISNRLNNDERNAFLEFIVKRWEYDNTKTDSELNHLRIDDQHIGELFTELSAEDINSFLRHDNERFEKLVQFIPQHGFAALKPELLGQLTPELINSLDQEQLFGIGPRRLTEIGPTNMAHLINRLDEESGNNFLKDISERFLAGKISEREFKEFISKFDQDRITKFLNALKNNRKNTEFFKSLYPKIFSHTEVSHPLNGLITDPSFKPSKTGVAVINAEGKREEIFPLGIFMRDSISTTYIFNGVEIDPVNTNVTKKVQFSEIKNTKENKDESLPRADFVAQELYEVAGKDPQLTLRLQSFLNQGTLSEPTRAVLEKYSLYNEVNPRFFNKQFIVNIDPENAEERMVRVHITSDLEMEVQDAIDKDGTNHLGYKLGYARMDTEILISVEDLLSVNEQNAKMTTTLSQVFSTKEELEEHNQAIARLTIPDQIHPERFSSYRGGGAKKDQLKLYREQFTGLKSLYEKAAAIDLDKLHREASQIYKSNPENMKARQDKAKEIANAVEALRAADAQAIDVATLKFRNAPAIISMTNKVGVRIRKNKSLEEIRKEFGADPDITDFLDTLEKNSLLALLDDSIKELRDEPEMFNIAKRVKARFENGSTLAEIREEFAQSSAAQEFLRELEQRQLDYPMKSMEELFEEAQSQLLKMFSIANPKFTFASQPYGFTRAKGDYIWKNDTSLVHDLVLKEIEPFRGKVLNERQKQKIRARVASKIEELTDESAASVRDLRDNLYVENAAHINEFKTKVKEAILNAFKNGEAVIPNNVQGEFREKYFPTAMSEEVEIGNVLELAFQEIARDTVKMAANVIVEEKQKVSRYPEKLQAESKAGKADALVSGWVDDLVERNKAAFYEIKVNYPDETQAYAKLLLDEVLNNPYRVR